MSGNSAQNSLPRPLALQLPLQDHDRRTNTQAARERRRLQNKIAQRNHRRRKAAQRATLESQSQNSQNNGAQCDQSLPTPPDPFSQHQALPALDDPLSIDNFLLDIEGLDQGDADFLKGRAADLFEPDSRALSSYTSRESPLPLELSASTQPVPSQRRSNGQLAIHIASKWGFSSIIDVLLKNGADPNLVDNRRRTALHYAVEGGYMESIKVLLRWGADPSAIDLSGLNSLQMAVSKGYHDVVCLLMDHGVDPNLGALVDDGTSGQVLSPSET
ncbi:Pc16g04540 [Talaromyces islandicus]|uniref:Pc16g04540 n=1 Tax=Talaromyces islandicus TaxID=28573 RepID=A0A0U1LI16_TALIS|nr:Pc16g04540 [Talaromyces islandicus]